jgi:hypothetical protein
LVFPSGKKNVAKESEGNVAPGKVVAPNATKTAEKSMFRNRTMCYSIGKIFMSAF